MRNILSAILLLSALLFPAYAISGSAVAAVDLFPECTRGIAATTATCKDVNMQKNLKANPVINLFKIILNIVSLIAGVALVVMLIIGGLRLMLSNGDSGGVANARNGLIYVLIGAIVIIMSQSIVVFVLNKI